MKKPKLKNKIKGMSGPAQWEKRQKEKKKKNTNRTTR